MKLYEIHIRNIPYNIITVIILSKRSIRFLEMCILNSTSDNLATLPTVGRKKKKKKEKTLFVVETRFVIRSINYRKKKKKDRDIFISLRDFKRKFETLYTTQITNTCVWADAGDGRDGDKHEILSREYGSFITGYKYTIYNAIIKRGRGRSR